MEDEMAHRALFVSLKASAPGRAVVQKIWTYVDVVAKELSSRHVEAHSPASR